MAARPAVVISSITLVEMVVLARLDLPAEPASVGRARRLVASAIEGRVDDGGYDAALVITSELATNAMLHAQTDFEVVVLVSGGGIRIEVHDGSTRMPRRKRYSDQSATGRGLLLLESLATDAGAEEAAGGKVVWAIVGGTTEEPPVVDRAAGAAEVVDLAAAPSAAAFVAATVMGEAEVERGCAPRPLGRSDRLAGVGAR